MGAIVCFELACYLKKHHNLEPVHMFLSGATAPYVSFVLYPSLMALYTLKQRPQ